MGVNPAPRVVAVVVSYNRRTLLELTLRGILGGTTVPQTVVVVDNASTDDSVPFIRQFAADHAATGQPGHIELVELQRNVGGAGGFTVGIDQAANVYGADLIWVMDDDTEPLPDTLSAAVTAWRDYDADGARRPAFVASQVLWTDGTEHPMNSMIERIGAGPRRKARAAAVGGRSIRSGSFVSLLMDGDAVRAAGLPIADYFIWDDDFEFSTRLARWEDAIQVPASKVMHHTKQAGNTDADPGPRFYNDVRNKLWVFTRSASLAPWEKVLYGGATARLWWRTLKTTDDRRAVTQRFLRGVRDALRAPRTNRQVLDGLWELTPDRGGAVGGSTPLEPGVDFSLLMPVYRGDTPQRFHRALLSSTLEQVRPPSEVVIVRDGPVDDDLQAELEALTGRLEQASPPIAVVRVDLPINAGLTNALRTGLRACTHDVVARADADDVSYPDRFARQLPVIEAGADVVGAGMNEIGDDESHILAGREAPVGAAEIRRVSKLRNPVSHPTVVMRRSAVTAVGGYEYVPLAEDYWLWVRLLKAGADIRNIAAPLVGYRVSGGAYQRRGGLAVFQAEMQLQSRLRGSGYLSFLEWLRNVAVRGGYRFVPRFVRERAYRNMVSGYPNSTHNG
ncbi:glycosyltransferase [Kocuria sp.]|uniref:glycosyltransferase n=1 Tax=Kocuria sp. TaxID=1871328 RepID=UPI0026DEDFB7|nr:glycosyltransferase [Kocuria sp.]MDO5618384.1 glycosyltransferase [Kocuria sp.]